MVAHLALNAEGLAGALGGIVAGRADSRCTRRRRPATATSRTSPRPEPARAADPAARRRPPTSPTRSPPCPTTPGPPGSSGCRAAATFRAGSVPDMRLREVEIHHADLDAGYTHADWTPEFAAMVIDSMGKRDACGRAVHGAGHRRRPVLDLRRGRGAYGVGDERRPGLVADRPGRGRRTDERRRRAAGDRGMVTYTGEVEPGGSPDVRELDALTITKVAVDREMSNNCYLLTCRAHRRPGAGRRGRRARAAAAADRRRRPRHRGHHPPALGPPPGPRRRRRPPPRAEVVAGAPDAAAITEQTGVPVRPGGRARATRSPSATARSR